ncbi:hypothetical protein ACVWYN_002831 [Pedobacter sp. UYP24]
MIISKKKKDFAGLIGTGLTWFSTRVFDQDIYYYTRE